MKKIQEQINLLKRSPSEKDREKCIRLIQEYLNENQKDVQAWYDLACCYDFLGKEVEASPCYQKVYELGVLKLEKDSQAGFFVGYGSTLRNTNNLESSEIILKEGIKLFPTYLPLKIFLAFTYHSQKNYKVASELLFQVCSEIPEGYFDRYERAIKFYTGALV